MLAREPVMNVQSRLSVQAAITSRILPDFIDDEWIAILAARRRRTAQSYWLVPAVFGAFVVLGGLAIAGSLLPDWIGWAGVVGALAVALASWMSAATELRAITRLEEQLGERD